MGMVGTAPIEGLDGNNWNVVTGLGSIRALPVD